MATTANVPDVLSGEEEIENRLKPFVDDLKKVYEKHKAELPREEILGLELYIRVLEGKANILAQVNRFRRRSL